MLTDNAQLPALFESSKALNKNTGKTQTCNDSVGLADPPLPCFSADFRVFYVSVAAGWQQKRNGKVSPRVWTTGGSNSITLVVNDMRFAQSKVTAQGQISVPAEVRRKLGLSPGSVLEWVEENGQVLIRRAGQFSSTEMNRALFPDGPPQARSIQDLKDGVRKAMRERHARR